MMNLLPFIICMLNKVSRSLGQWLLQLYSFCRKVHTILHICNVSYKYDYNMANSTLCPSKPTAVVIILVNFSCFKLSSGIP